jgi:hypothetical protein
MNQQPKVVLGLACRPRRRGCRWSHRRQRRSRRADRVRGCGRRRRCRGQDTDCDEARVFLEIAGPDRLSPCGRSRQGAFACVSHHPTHHCAPQVSTPRRRRCSGRYIYDQVWSPGRGTRYLCNTAPSFTDGVCDWGIWWTRHGKGGQPVKSWSWLADSRPGCTQR